MKQTSGKCYFPEAKDQIHIKREANKINQINVKILFARENSFPTLFPLGSWIKLKIEMGCDEYGEHLLQEALSLKGLKKTCWLVLPGRNPAQLNFEETIKRVRFVSQASFPSRSANLHLIFTGVICFFSLDVSGRQLKSNWQQQNWH